MKKLVLIVALVLILSVAAIAAAYSDSHSGTLSAASPTFNRPVNCSGLSGVGTNVYYDAYSFVAPYSEAYDFIYTSTTIGDGFLAIYQGSFNPASPLTNCYTVNDDSVGLTPQILDLPLTGGTTYIAVTTTFGNGATGDFTLDITAPDAPGINFWPDHMQFIEGGSDTLYLQATSVPAADVEVSIDPGPNCEIDGQGADVVVVVTMTDTAIYSVEVGGINDADDSNNYCEVVMTTASTDANYDGLTGTVIVDMNNQANVPNKGEIQINAGAPVEAYAAAGNYPTGIILPADYDGNGFDTYTVTGSATVADQMWYSIFLGNETWVWVPANQVTVLR